MGIRTSSKMIALPRLGRIGEVAQFLQRFLLRRTKGPLLEVCGITHSPSTPQRILNAVKAIIGGREDGRLYLADARRLALHPIIFVANGTSGVSGLRGGVF